MKEYVYSRIKSWSNEVLREFNALQKLCHELFCLLVSKFQGQNCSSNWSGIAIQLSQSKRILFVIVAIVILLLLMSRGCDRSERSEGCETIPLGAKNSIRKTASNAYIDTIKYRKVREMAVRRQKMLEEGIMSASNIISRVSKRLRELDTPAPLSDVCAGYVDPIEDSVFYADGKDFIVLKSESRTVGFLVLYGRKNYRRIHIADLPALMNYEVRNPFPAGYYRATGRYINEHSLQMYKNKALLQIVDTSLPSVAATRPNTALALWGRARPAGHPAARFAA